MCYPPPYAENDTPLAGVGSSGEGTPSSGGESLTAGIPSSGGESLTAGTPSSGGESPFAVTHLAVGKSSTAGVQPAVGESSTDGTQLTDYDSASGRRPPRHWADSPLEPMKGKHLTRVLVGILDFFLSATVFWKFSREGSLFGDYRYLLSLSAVWVLLGFVTGKLDFDRYRKVGLAEAAVSYIDVFCYVAIYYITRIKGFGVQGPDLSIWGLPVIVAVELLLFFLYASLMVHKLPTYYEGDPAVSPAAESGIDFGAKLYKAPSLSEKDSVISPDRMELLFRMHELAAEHSWEELQSWIYERREELETFSLILPTNNVDAPELTHSEGCLAVMCMEKLNNARQLNCLMEKVNALLPKGGFFLVHATTSAVRKQRILESCPKLVGQIVCFLDFLWSRVTPKLSLTRSFYFSVTDGRNRSLPRVEILGRMSRAGFDIVNESQSQGELFVSGVKVSAPHNSQKPNYGPIIKLNRVGKGGETINVFKLRSMYSYSEYIQQYAYNILGLQNGGKLKDDFRVTPYGRFIRRCWIDELPMLVNLIRGDLKLVGVRPLSRHYFSLYTPEMQAIRCTVKPGLVPPFYADKVRPVTIADVQESERRYIEAYHKAPFKTDFNYLCRAFVNIVFRHSRSH